MTIALLYGGRSTEHEVSLSSAAGVLKALVALPDTEVELIGLNEASATLVDKFAVHDKPEAVEKLMGGH